MDDSSEIITWQEQAEAYQNALEAALTHQDELEEQISNLGHEVHFFQNEIRKLTAAHEDTLMQRDQVIIKQEKEIAHIKHILQIQQHLLRVRKSEAK